MIQRVIQNRRKEEHVTEETKPRVKCPELDCGKDFQPIASGMIRAHKRDGLFCEGGGKAPLVEGPVVSPFDTAAPLEGSPEFTYRDTAGREHGNGGRLCRVCKRPHPLTPNGRVRTHPALAGPGNCEGGSDFPSGDYPDIEGATSTDPRPTAQELKDAEAAYSFGGDLPHDVETAAQDVIDRATKHGTRPTDPEVSAITANGHATDAAAAFLGLAGPGPETTGPEFFANFGGDCDTCGAAYDEGDRIRADGDGGWEAMECCGDVTGGQAPYSLTDASAAAGALTPEKPKRVQADIGEVADFFGVGGPTESAPAAPEAPKRVQASMGDVADFFGLGGPAAPTVAPPAPATAKADEISTFLAAVPAADDNADRYGRWGKYKILHPETGKDNCLFTRATTMAKDISSTFALNQWKRRKAVYGLTIEPSLLDALRLLDPEKKDDQKTIDALLEKAEQAAGSKIGAELGTALHSLTERLDKGEGSDIVPPAFSDHVREYRRMLTESGLVPVQELIERTTVVLQYSTAGTMDRVFLVTKRLVLNLPGRQVTLDPGEYVIGDLKTAKGMQYAWGETAIQLAVYAHGLNSHGYFDWETRLWVQPTQEGQLSHDLLKVREDVAVVVHLPADKARAESAPGVYGLDIGQGWAALGLVDQVRKWRSVKTLAGAMDVADLQIEPVQEEPAPAPKERHLHAVPSPSWEDRFSAVTSAEEAGALWKEASSTVPADELDRLVGIAREALARPVSTGCTACDEGGHVCPGCGDVTTHERPVCWSDLFRTVKTREEATDLWKESSAAGVPPDERDRLVGLAKEELTRLAALAAAVEAPPERNWSTEFSSVVTSDQAAKLYAEAVDAGLPADLLDTLVKLAKAKLSAPTAPPAVQPKRPVEVVPPPKAPEPAWGSRFAAVETKAAAGALWVEAEKAGVPKAELDRLVGIAKERLTALAQRQIV